eukprot:461832-Pleurochrysis_carterae.AAC.1
MSDQDPLAGSIRGIRCMAIPNGFATHTGVLGHDLINFLNNIEASVINLPAVVEFCDGGVADVMALSFKLAANSKLYMQCVILPLMIGKSKEGKETWVDERKCALVKLDVIKQFKAIKNSDGCAPGKQLDRFLNLHSTTFKARSQSFLAANAPRCKGYRWRPRHRSARQFGSGGAGNHSAELDTVANMKAELQLAHEQLLDCDPYYNAPLTQ